MTMIEMLGTCLEERKGKMQCIAFWHTVFLLARVERKERVGFF